MWRQLMKYDPNSLIGRTLRLPLHLIPKTATLPIVTGPARGLQWRVGSGQYGYWFGTTEDDKRMLFNKMISNGTVVYDIGANVGYYTILAAHKIGNKGRVVAFEPVPENVRRLGYNVSVNGFGNVDVYDCALSDRSGVGWFALTAHPNTGRLATAGDLQVPVFALDEIVRDKALPPPDVMKIDVEGAEAAVLAGASETISLHHPATFVAVHSATLKEQCITFMMQFGYEVSEVANHADELLFVHPDLTT